MWKCVVAYFAAKMRTLQRFWAAWSKRLELCNVELLGFVLASRGRVC
ncbi:hypothetical protein BN2476_620057 [Paraburkholderia piptadeniae]|uniref:Transposase n=1 Tax=Paraburkholderia piptadeniae TaxID=1701573 RepID=A0A1N7SKX4_9BURK|nr:hypothetical protein BN2476_620057 [Paraburkholderia piptadeniae]